MSSQPNSPKSNQPKENPSPITQQPNSAHSPKAKSVNNFLTGANVAWMLDGFGCDIATCTIWGYMHTYNHDQCEKMFGDLDTSGCGTMRWWLFADGRGDPLVDDNHTPIGLDADFLPTIFDVLQVAQERNITLIFTWWSFDMLLDGALNQLPLVVDDNKRKALIDNVVVPLLQAPVPGTSYTVGSHPNILAWEVINEPEWVIAESGSVDSRCSQPATLAQMQQFVADHCAAVHKYSTQMCNVGSACMKWNSDTIRGAMGNWWSDASLTPFDSQGYVDFYQIHYYGWMNGVESYSFSPVKIDFKMGGFDKPTIIGEFPANGHGTGHSTLELLEAFMKNGYSGGLAWTYSGDGTPNGNWTDCEDAYKTFNQV